MPSALSVRLAPGDRKILFILAAFCLALAAAALVIGPVNPQEGFGIPSSYSYGPGGARAAYVLLEESGYDVARWEKSPLELPSRGDGTILIFSEPVYTAGEEERQALVRFLRTGGRIVATGGIAASTLLPEGGAISKAVLPGETQSYAALLPSPITRDAGEIELVPESAWAHLESRQLALYGAQSEPVVVTYRVGDGRVVWWAGAWPLTNLGISAKQNLQLFLNSVGPPQGVKVLWDEYFHGERGSLWSYLKATPVPWAGLQLGLFAVAVVATFGRRWGPAMRRRTESRLSPLEFVDTLGALYQRAHAAPPAVRVSLQRFRFLLTRRLGLAASLDAKELGRAASARLGRAAEGVSEALTRAEMAAAQLELDDKTALATVRTLDGYAEALRLTGRPHAAEVSSAPNHKGARNG
ncbi:MAG TPA: DUF4350 domain-containing protein [Candidatus Acidoferrales bacterium]|nr:DUF4350 domain-containing protein [Candidatus Acidoferrales bacterium]